MIDHAPPRRPRIVLGLDGSVGSRAAVDWCVRHAPALDAEVVGVFALNPLVSVVPASVLPDESPMWEEGAVKQIAEELHEWCRPLDEAGVSARTSVVRGTPFEVLERIADEEDAVMIVVGRSGRGGISEMLLGSVPHSLTHHAMRPVLVVPVR